MRRREDDPPVEVALPRWLGAREVRETHCSWVFLTATHAYKLKKPVRFGFVDQASPEARRRACEEEVRVNRALAPDVVLGVRGVVPGDDGPALGDADDARALDWVVEMRRFDEDLTMAARAGRGALGAEDVAAVGRRIARFHATAPTVVRPDAAAAAGAMWSRNLDELAGLGHPELVPALDALRAFAQAFVARRGPDLDARGLGGSVREGHGDLRAEHVLLDGAVTIVDRLEFDRGLRELDVSDDLAFLAMDLEACGVRWAARTVVEAYRREGGEPGDDGLIAFFGAHRALVRAKVELLRAAQLSDEVAAERCADRACGLVRLAEHLAWRARPAPALVICGPPASGKSHLARALAARTGAVVLSSDAARKELLGLDPAERAPDDAYGAAERAAVYDELARRLCEVPQDAAVIVDATFGSRAVRSRFRAQVGGAPLRWIECRAPVETLVARARSRPAGGRRGSDAGPEVAARLALAFEPLEDVAAAAHLEVDGTAPASDVVRRIGTWLDASRYDVWAAGLRGSSGARTGGRA